MSKKIAISIASSLLLSQTAGLCDLTDQLVALDDQRDALLKQITHELVAGKIGPTDADQLKTELGTVVVLESKAQEDKNVTDAEYKDIKDALDKVQADTQAATHTSKVWMGIDSRDNTLQKKISDALDARKISKEQAGSLIDEEEKLRARETNGDPNADFDFTAALSIAHDIMALDSKIDQLASTGHTE